MVNDGCPRKGPRLRTVVFVPPSCDDAAASGEPPQEQLECAPGNPVRAWREAAAAAACLDTSACASLFSHVDQTSRALILSQAGPGGSHAVTVFPAPAYVCCCSICCGTPASRGTTRCRCHGVLSTRSSPTASLCGASFLALACTASRPRFVDFSNPRGHSVVSFGLGLSTGTAWIRLKRVCEAKKMCPEKHRQRMKRAHRVHVVWGKFHESQAPLPKMTVLQVAFDGRR